MTAQIINLADRRQAIHRHQADPYEIGYVWPVILVSCAAFWLCVGVAVVRAWPLVSLP